MHTYAPAHFLSIADLDRSDFNALVNLSRDLRWSSFNPGSLAGLNVVLIFEKPSLRTRVTFEVAVRKLGGWPMMLDGSEGRLGGRESIPDMARNLSLWVDGIVARVYSHQALQELASFSTVPVVNALSDY